MRTRRTFVLAVALLLAAFNTVHAGKKDKPEIDTKPANIVDLKLNLAPFLTGGVVIGKTAELIDDFGGDDVDKALYGFGLSLTYYPQPRYGLQASIQRGYKTVPGEDVSNGQGWFYSVSGIYNLRTLTRSIPYARLDVGLFTAKWPQSGPDLELGTYSFIRLGFGLFSYSSKSYNMRYELYYTRAFSKGRQIDDLWGYEVDFFGECIGIEFGIGIPIMKR
ncbi:MAG: hypothetical protein AB1483_10085 [Candidatus Zixiibacteriota bacterium]